MKAALLALVLLSCSDTGSSSKVAVDASLTEDEKPDGASQKEPHPDAGFVEPCPGDATGLDCLFSLWDDVQQTCEPAAVAAFSESIARRHGELPAWHGGRALFVSFGSPAAVAGDMNSWRTDALATQRVCESNVYAVETALSAGRYQYKLVFGTTWQLDPENYAFAYDDFSGNLDGRNSVLNTYDSGLGHLVRPTEEMCSVALGRCRPFTTYLPAGYGAPENTDRHYPVLFMHDGQNVFDDHDCCFGHTGWEVNVTLDQEIAFGIVEPVVVAALDHAGSERANEYAFGSRETFMEFQVEEAQPKAFELWRLDASRVYVAGSSFGGHISVLLAFTYPDVYTGAASLSGAFWPDSGSDHSIFSVVANRGYVPVGLYMDHGGGPEDGGDGYWDNLAMGDLLVSLGWFESTAPDCTLADNSLCYFWDPGALHDEFAWRDRAYLFLRYFFGTD